MIELIEKKQCCGCTACENVCPINCIHMVPDREGFLYPQIDEEKCKKCGLCHDVCPIINFKVKEDYYMPKAYVLRIKNNEALLESTSGGFATAFASWLVNNKGSIWCASYDDSNNVIHQKFEKIDNEFSKARGSKYVQSDLGKSFTAIEKDLNAGKLVGFIGTTCQVSGLKSFLRRTYDNLVTVDLVCHGTPSPKLWKKYVEFQEKIYNSKIVKINFRNKTYGYHSGTMLLEFENGSKYTGSARVDYMLKSFFSEISSRPSCYSCSFKAINRESDFTLFDCWHAADLVKDLKDDDKGYTNILVHNKKAERILKEMGESIFSFEVDVREAIEKDGIMVTNSAKPHSNRDEFYLKLDKEDIGEYIPKVLNIRKIDYVIEHSKAYLYKWGMIKLIKKIKRGD